MKNVLIASVIAMSTATAVLADSPQYVLEPIEPVCTNTDLAIGIGAGVVGGAIIGVSSIIGAPVVGAAAGTTMTWGMAFSAPFLTNATASLAATGVVLGGPFVGFASYYASCLLHEVF
ncbi:hypothetical protein N9Z41_02470 [bacterium]|nr:hypothetical protein [bacterium]